MSNRCWNLTDISDLTGKTAIVTGANAGLGFKSSLELARKQAHVILACRSLENGQTAIQRIKQELPQASLETISLDLSNLASVHQFAETFHTKHHQLDLLLNNAGVVNLEHLQHNSAGQEMHMAVNHLGHFALTGLLSESLIHTPHARVVTLSSGGYKAGTIDFDDFKWKKRTYSRTKAYGDSKLANLLFMHSLQTYFDTQGSNALSVAAHPGLTGTERQQSIGIGGWLSHCLASPVEKGVQPQLMAATSQQTKARDFYGPRWGIWGNPHKIGLDQKAQDAHLAKQLWDYSLELTGVKFAIAY